MKRKVERLENDVERLEKGVEKAIKSAVEHVDLFRTQTDKYSQFSAERKPTHDAQGDELSKSAKKNVEKEWLKAANDFNKFQTENEKVQGKFIENLKTELQQTKDQLQQLEQTRPNSI